MTSSDKQDWLTPELALDVVRKVAPIGLDPCTHPSNPTGAREFYCLENGQDGSILDWNVRSDELMFINSEYGSALPRWCNRVATEASKGKQLIQLMPARTDTEHWLTATDTADAFALWKGRITFDEFVDGKRTPRINAKTGRPDPAPFPVVFIYSGCNPSVFCEAFTPHAQVHLQGAGW